MDVLSQFYLPPNLQEFSIGAIILLIFGCLLIMSLITSLAAFIASAPKSSLIRAFFAVIIHITFALTIFLVLVNINQPPNQDVIVAILLITAAITYSTCFISSIIKGGIVALIAAALYFLTYKCLSLYLQTQYPDIYLEFMEVIDNLSNQYQMIRY